MLGVDVGVLREVLVQIGGSSVGYIGLLEN